MTWVSVLLVSFLAFVSLAHAASFLYKRPFLEPLPNYPLRNKGNCMWFAWECAWQEYGIRLPFAEDWAKLDGRTGSTDDKKAWKAVLSRHPEPGSIMVMQPPAGEKSGHVAWVVSWRRSGNYFEVDVLESTTYPPSGWGDSEYYGCKYKRTTYYVGPHSSTKFLVFRFGKVVEDERGRRFVFDTQ